MKPCVTSTPTAFHFMAVAMDMQHRTPDKCGTGLIASVKSPLSFDMCCPCTTRRTLSLLTFSLCSCDDKWILYEIPKSQRLGFFFLTPPLW
jgi:hypothetical protein